MAEKTDGRKAGTTAAPPQDDITPVATADTTRVADLERQLAAARADAARVAAENERLKAGPAVGLYVPGKRYLVELAGNPSVVVEPKDGEHPYECYKALLGIIRSDNAPTVQETELPVGRVA